MDAIADLEFRRRVAVARGDRDLTAIDDELWAWRAQLEYWIEHGLESPEARKTITTDLCTTYL